MNLSKILNDEPLKKELLDKLAPGSSAGRSRGIVVPFDSGVKKAQVHDFVREDAALHPPPGLDIREAIIRRFGRPVLRAWGNTFEEPPSDVWRDRLNAARPWLEAAIPAVGRIEL